MNTKNFNEIASQFVNVSIFQILQVSVFLMQSSRGAPHVFFKISAYIILSLANLHWLQCSWNMESHMSSDQLTWLSPVNWEFCYLFATGL